MKCPGATPPDRKLSSRALSATCTAGARHHLWTEDDTLALIVAVRYALPRESYAAAAMADLTTRAVQFLSQGDRELLAREIERYAREPQVWRAALNALYEGRTR